MTWDIILASFVRVGIPLTVELVEKWLSATPVTEEQWREVRVKALSTAKDRVRLQLVAAGIDPDSEQGKKFLALAS